MHAKKITFIGIFAALAVVLSLIAIPYPLVPFLKFDLSEIVVLVAVSTVGLTPAIFIALLSALLNFLILGPVGPFGIGQVALFLSGVTIAASYALFRQKFKLSALVSMVITSIFFTIVITTLNYFWITPIYFGMNFTTALESISLVQFGLSDTTVFLNPYLTATLLVYIPFNLLKMFFVSFAFISVKRTLIHQI
ncbi:MAG: ECF transporter S component, partial [Culicoidibacterales bacterium]